jgi:hypothetical protein
VNKKATGTKGIQGEQLYFCSHRNLSFTVQEVQQKRSLGNNCYLGSKEGDICQNHGRLCDVIRAYKSALLPSMQAMCSDLIQEGRERQGIGTISAQSSPSSKIRREPKNPTFIEDGARMDLGGEAD